MHYIHFYQLVHDKSFILCVYYATLFLLNQKKDELIPIFKQHYHVLPLIPK